MILLSHIISNYISNADKKTGKQELVSDMSTDKPVIDNKDDPRTKA